MRSPFLPFAAVFFALAAFQSFAAVPPPTVREAVASSPQALLKGVTVTWLGHACFQIVPTTGPKIVIDPFKGPFGTYPTPDPVGNVVLITHSHFDHNAPEEVKGKPVVIRTAGVHPAAKGVFKGIAAWHDDQGGKQRGPDLIYVFTVDKLRFCHLGDLGQHALTPQQLRQIGHVDVLMIPVGGFFTIDARQADGIIRQIKPRVIIPMHYKTPLTPQDLPLVSAEGFLKGKRNVQRLKSNTDTLTWATLPKAQTVLVFSPPQS